MVTQNVSLHTPRNVIHARSLAYTPIFTHLDAGDGVSVEPETAGVQNVEPSSYI